MQLHELQANTKRVRARRVGRGGKRGKTSGRGMKGQKARAGHSLRPEMRDQIKKIPKLRGHGKNRARTINDSVVPAVVVNVAALESMFNNGDAVNPQTLKAHGLIRAVRGMKRAPVKILGEGNVSKKLIVSGCTLSASAREKIEKAGGVIA